jgi:hypothetical protein
VTRKEALGLRPGDRVLWPAGAWGSAECRGTVRPIRGYNFREIIWDDGQVTCVLDDAAMACVVRDNEHN